MGRAVGGAGQGDMVSHVHIKGMMLKREREAETASMFHPNEPGYHQKWVEKIIVVLEQCDHHLRGQDGPRRHGKIF